LHDVPCFLWALPLSGRKVITFHGYERDPVDPLHFWLHKVAEWGTQDNFCVGGYLLKHYKTRCKPENVFIGAVDSKKVGARSLPLEKKYTKRALFLTRLAWDTQIREYVEAMRLLPGFQLDVYGDGPLRKEIEETVRREGLPVKIFGPWPGDSNDLMRKYKFVFASRYLTLLEALANGAVVFSVYNTPVMKDVLTCVGAPDESLVICKTPREITERLKVLAENPSALRKASSKARAFARPLSWGKLAEIYLNVYLRATNRKDSGQ
jgi:glycosyltransferase involved in cell wall biosynthesis